VFDRVQRIIRDASIFTAEDLYPTYAGMATAQINAIKMTFDRATRAKLRPGD
jgi:hypothetical protein